MRRIPYTVTLILVVMVMASATITHAQDTGGALVSVEVEDENDTSIEVIVDEVRPSQSEESFVDPNAEPFIPTKDWKQVKPGQSVPSGLHIRLNLETGEREAKLMDGDDGSRFKMIDGTDSTRLKQLKKTFEESMKNVDTSESALKYWQEDGKQGILNTNKDSFTRGELKDALKQFKASNVNVDVKQDKREKRFRSMADLKQELKELELEVKTDQEILDRLVTRYRRQVTTQERTNILEDLELLVHQIDNAQYLVACGGFQLIVNDLNHTDPIIGQSSALVIGSAVQSNPQVQVAALKAGVLPQLILKLSTSTDSKIQHKFLYALSTLVRHFPHAQQRLVEGGGLQTLIALLTTADDVKVKVKVITLVTDIILERKQAKEQYGYQESEVLREKIQQYEKVDIIRQLREKHWCENVPSLLSVSDHDTREKTLIAMDTIMDTCVDYFSSSLPQLKLLKKEYSLLAVQESKQLDSDSYFRDLLNRIENIFNIIEEYHENTRHNDL